MLNASVGVQRVLGRLRPGPGTRSTAADHVHRRALAIARRAADGLDAARSRSTVSVRRRLGADTLVPVAVAGIVLAGSVLSVLPDALPSGPQGGPDGEGQGPRLVVGGGGVLADAYDADSAIDPGRFRLIDPGAYVTGEAPAELVAAAAPLDGPFLDDGTLVKPMAVDTSVADGRGLLRTHRVRSGETLVGIAREYGVSMKTVWWANDLDSKDALKVGTVLTIPPVDGLVVVVESGDTLESLAKEHKADADEIYQTNGLEDRVLVIGQTLVIPGAKGEPLPTPTPKPTPKPVRNAAPPRTYSGGSFVWPVVGGGNYISQYYHYGHYGIDIAADYGSRVRAAARGTVIFAGWKNNGGGYQVHISHGSGLYTTYNHMSSVSVGRGQSVARGQQVGRIGQTGYATGPHLHFEVWRGGIWNGGRRVNPLAYF